MWHPRLFFSFSEEIGKLSKYLPRVKLDTCSIGVHQEIADKLSRQNRQKSHIKATYLSSLLICVAKWKGWLPFIGRGTYPHVPYKARMNMHQASYLKSIYLVWLFSLLHKYLVENWDFKVLLTSSSGRSKCIMMAMIPLFIIVLIYVCMNILQYSKTF